MILITHAIVGASVAQLFPSHPVVGFFAGVASHYLSDTIPHWNYGEGFGSVKRKYENNLAVMDKIIFGPKIFLEASIVIIDIILGFALAWLVWDNSSQGNPLLLLAGAFGGMLPDYLQIFYGLWNNKITSILNNFHSFTHAPERLKIKNLLGGILSQAVFVVVIVYLVKLIA